MFRAIGLTAGPEYPPCEPRPRTAGRVAHVSRSSPTSELIVLMRATPSAPPWRAARAATVMSVMFGVSLTRTGTSDASFAHPVIISMYSGTWPTADPIPRSAIPCGQP